MLLAQKDKATQQILHLTQQLAQRDLAIQQLNAQLAAASQHSHTADTSDAFTALLAKYETTLTQAQHYKDRAKHFKAHAQQLHDRLREVDSRQPTAAVSNAADPHVTLLRQQARDWKDRAEAAERRAAGLEARVRDVAVKREVVGLLRQRVGVLQGELRLVRDEVPVLVSETVVRVQGEVQRVVGDMGRRLAAQREENRTLQGQLLSLRHKMNSRYESLLLEHHRHSRQYAALLAEEEDVLRKPASLSPLPLPLAYTKETQRPTHHRTTTSHSHPTPTSSDTAVSSSNNTQRSSSQPRDSLSATKAHIRPSATKLHTTNGGGGGRTRQSLFTDNDSDSADDEPIIEV